MTHSLYDLPICIYVQVSGFRSYVDLYLKNKVDELGSPLTVVHEMVNERWEVCLTMSEKGFQQVSFVNSIATTKVPARMDRGFTMHSEMTCPLCTLETGMAFSLG